MVRPQTQFSDDEMIARAAQVGVGLMSARSQYLNQGGKDEFFFGYGKLSETYIQIGVQRLSEVIETKEF